MIDCLVEHSYLLFEMNVPLFCLSLVKKDEEIANVTVVDCVVGFIGKDEKNFELKTFLNRIFSLSLPMMKRKEKRKKKT